MTEIEEYLSDKAKQVKLEKLIAWKDFYTQCNNDYLAELTQRQINRL